MRNPTESAFDQAGHAPYLHELALGALALLTLGALASRAGISHPVTCEAAAAAIPFAGTLVLLSRWPGDLQLKLRFVASFLFVTWFYAATRRIVPALGLEPRDAILLAADETLFGTTPALALRPYASPLITDGLSLCYLSYFAYLDFAFLDSLRGSVVRATRLAPPLLLAFALGMAGYLWVPALGPAAAFPSSFAGPLPGGAISHASASFVASNSSVYDCFPSLHLLITVVLLAHDWVHARLRFYVMTGPAVGILIATLYLRYHYAVDLLAALALFCSITLLHRQHPARPRATSQPASTRLPAQAFSVRPTSALDAHERATLAAFATAIMPCAAGDDYVVRRFDRYPLVATISDGVASGFVLLDGFTEHGESHVYVGPMFARGGAAMRMIAELVRALGASGGATFHLAAEVENPCIIELLERLVPSALYPRRGLDVNPPEVERAARAFAQRIRHVRDFDPVNWRTRSNSSLYLPAPRRSAIVSWLAERDVDLARGDAQLVVVSCSNEPERRAQVQRELARGLASQRRPRSHPSSQPSTGRASHV